MSKNHCSPDNLPEQVQFHERNGYASLAGQRFGRLEVLYYVGQRYASWLCLCDCGQHTAVAGGALRKGKTRSCGCLQAERSAAASTVHGGYGTTEYRRWDSMIQRCVNKNHKHYHNYGGRGIKVCERWRNSFAAFLEDLGPRPSANHSIDRIDNNGDYCPENCRWATKAEQVRNTRRNRLVAFRGETLCVADLARRHGLTPQALQGRLNAGWPVERAITTPIRPHLRMLTHNGKTLSVTGWARELGVRYGLLANRLACGWSVERALSEPIRSEKYSKQRG
ncbi:MAG: hypothetical protein WC114_10175 [Smithellaceae bacterium]